MSLLSKISNMGMNGDETFIQSKVIILINRYFSIFYSINLIFTVIIFIVKRERLYSTYIITLICLTIVAFGLKKGKHQLAVYLLIIIELSFVLYVATVGYRTYVYYYLIPLFIFSIIVIDNIKRIYFIALIITSGFIACSFLQNHFYDPAISNQSLITPFFMTTNIIIILLSIFITFHYKLINNAYEHNLTLQKNKIEQQHKTLNLIHSDIKSSITYAKRIQNAILPPQRIIKSYLKNFFILYQPKEVISGDFYWSHLINNRILFAVADCTGDGVSGAMISVVCHNALNKSVREYGLSDPGEILNQTKKNITKLFEKSTNNNHMKGMDIILVSIPLDYQQSVDIEYAGANRPLVVVQENNIQTYKTNRHQIGSSILNDDFETHQLNLLKSDMIYLYTNGYSSQFGGKKNKKIKEKKFKVLLSKISPLNVTSQSKELETFFNNWKGDLEQLDDVCVVGIKI